jgi:hypothetical protein
MPEIMTDLLALTAVRWRVFDAAGVLLHID